MRSLALFALLALLVCAACPSATHGLEAFEQCGNRELCGDNTLICLANICHPIPDGTDPEEARKAEGMGNQCSPDDCCNGQLVCDAGEGLCVYPFGQTIFVCGGGGATTTAEQGGLDGDDGGDPSIPVPIPDVDPTPDNPDTPTDPNTPNPPDTPDNPQDPNTPPPEPDQGGSDQGGEQQQDAEEIPLGQAPRTGLELNAVCGNQDTCGENLSCLGNKCVPGTANALAGLGNLCSTQNCCPNGLVCNKESDKCAPRVQLLEEHNCDSGFVGGAGTGVPYQRANNEGSAPRTDLPENSACGNQDSCASGFTCTANLCHTGNGGGVAGIGNMCSATNCCPNRLACNAATSRCTPAIVQLASIDCTSGFVGGEGSGVEYQAPQPIDINNPDTYNPNSAMSLSAPATLLAMLASITLLVARW